MGARGPRPRGRLNALFSSLTGLLLAFGHGPVGAWLGLAEPRALLALGLVLLAFAGHLLWASTRRIHALEALYFVASDALWVLGTAVVVLAFPATFSVQGRLAALAVAAVVGGLAVAQARGLRQGVPSSR